MTAAQAFGEGDVTSENAGSRPSGRRRPSEGSSSAGVSRSRREVRQVTPAEQTSGKHADKPAPYDKAPLDERRAAQQLAQEQATFEQAKFQDKCFFILRLVMGVVAILALPAIMYVCFKIISEPHQDVVVRREAAAALIVNAGTMPYAWKVFVRPSSVYRLGPLTRDDEASATVNRRLVSPLPKNQKE
jgi:hypothetical protein